MNPPCAKCQKTVYPVEKLSCLDKVWHKGCFRCSECGLALTMKNYKGYNKMPYCSTHYPTTKFTSVPDTPENRRLAQNTQNVSQVSYHKQFNEEKSKFQPVPEIASHNKFNITSGKTATPVYNPQPTHATNQPAPASYPQTTRQTTPQPASNPPRLPPMQIPEPVKSRKDGDLYRCMFDYTAADDDEVSFSDGDIIEDATIIDEGWMTGTVQSTGEQGMLPANYVQLI